MHDEPTKGGESHRPDSAHRESARGSVDLSLACGVSETHGVNQAEAFESAPAPVRVALKRLDVLVFEAMSGSGRALEQVRILWPSLQIEIADELASDLREEYLKYALTIWTRYLAHDLPDPLRAVDALEVMCLLFDD